MLPFKKFSGLDAPQTPTCKAPPFTVSYAPAKAWNSEKRNMFDPTRVLL